MCIEMWISFLLFCFHGIFSYHQKYRLQGHADLCETLGLCKNHNGENMSNEMGKLLQTSYVATKLNGYLAGVGGLEQFKSEIDTFGLTPTQKEYCLYYIEKHQGEGLYC